MARDQFHIRGEERHALVEDLALGDLTQADLATKFERHPQTIAQFSARNAAEIAGRRRALQGELATETDHLWVADKTARIAWRQKLAEDLDGYLSDPDLDRRLRVRYVREINSLLRNVAEEKGELPTRSHAEVEISSSIPLGNRLIMTPDGQFHELAG
jgi:hypothetical protein